MMIAFTVGQPQPLDLPRIRIGSGRSPAISRSTTSIGTAHSDASAATVSSYCPCWAKPTSAASSSLPSGAAPRSCAGRPNSPAAPTARGDFGRNLRQHAPDLGLDLGPRRGEQPLLHHFGRLEQEVAEQPRRDVGAKPDLLGQRNVSLRVVDQPGEAAARQLRVGVLDDAAHHLGVAAADQHVGHRLGDAGAAGNGEQMGLALGPGDRHKIGIGEPARTASAPARRSRCRRPAQGGAPRRSAHCRRAPAGSTARRAPSIRFRRSAGRTRRRTAGHGPR